MTGEPQPEPRDVSPPPPSPPPAADVPPLALAGLLIAVIVGLLLVIALIFGLGPFAPPTDISPTPTTVVQQPPSPAPTDRPTSPPPTGPAPTEPTPALPTPAPTPSPSPVPLPTDAASLLGRIPEEVRRTCAAQRGTSPVVAFATCTPVDGTLVVVYSLYASAAEMHDVYDRLVAMSAEIERDTGSCARPTTWPAEGEYTVGEEGRPGGRLLCISADDGASITWTDDLLNILSVATSREMNFQRLWLFWQTESGPY